MKNTVLVLVQLLILVMATNGVASAAGAEQQTMIKDPAENSAYAHAVNTSDAWDKATALEAFLIRYPNTVVKAAALQELMDSYQITGNPQKAEETAKRLIAVDNSNVKALLLLTVLSRAEVTNDNLNLDDLCANSQRGIAVVPGWQKPAGVAEANFGSMKNRAAAVFYGGAGFCALKKSAYGVARENYLKALALNPEDLDNNYQLGITELESSPSDQNGFWYLAKAIHLAEAQHDRATQARIEEYGVSKYKKQNGGDDGWASFKAAVLHTTPPSAPAAANNSGRTDAEAACQAVKENAPEELSFSDWEFVLQQRDAGACNIEAANKVWTAIQEHAKTPVQLSVKVISSSSNKLRVAVTDDNQKANQVDLVITMENQMQDLPADGAMVNIMGVFTGYQLNPFFFSMAQGRLATGPAKN